MSKRMRKTGGKGERGKKWDASREGRQEVGMKGQKERKVGSAITVEQTLETVFSEPKLLQFLTQ